MTLTTATAPVATSVADAPRQYTPYSYYNPNRTITFEWKLENVEPGATPVVLLSVSHNKDRKQVDVDIRTAVIEGGVQVIEYAMIRADRQGDAKWRHRYENLPETPMLRFSRKKLEEIAAAELAAVQESPEYFARFFETDESAGGR